MATSHWRRPRWTLLRSHALSRAMGADLHVLQVLPGRGDVGEPWLEPAASDHEAWSERRLMRWCTRRLPEQLPRGNIEARIGGFVETVVAVARELRAALIVLPPFEAEDGSRVTSIALGAGAPVMVARSSASLDTIVAATDLRDPRYPVLRGASSLSGLLDAPLVLMHNVLPEIPPLVIPWAGVPPELGSTADARVRISRRRLAHLKDELAPEADTVVTHDPSTVDAIVGVAEERHADLVVVGARSHGWIGGLLSSRTAVGVVESAHESVLVLPCTEHALPALT